jgi:hypothetical protein
MAEKVRMKNPSRNGRLAKMNGRILDSRGAQVRRNKARRPKVLFIFGLIVCS